MPLWLCAAVVQAGAGPQVKAEEDGNHDDNNDDNGDDDDEDDDEDAKGGQGADAGESQEGVLGVPVSHEVTLKHGTRPLGQIIVTNGIEILIL